MKNPALRFVLLAAGILPVLALAGTAKVIHPTELHADSQSDSQTLTTLREGTSVEVVQRRGRWSQVKAAGQTGWVNMLDLLSDATGATSNSPNAAKSLADLSNLGRKSNAGTETNAVRGMTEEDIKNAQSNPAEFSKMQALASDKPTAQKFGRKNNLNPNQMSYLGDGNSSSRKEQ